jgi:hypothetical protein
MEHLSIAIECRSVIDDDGDGWTITMVMAGTGGKQTADVVGKWLYELVSTKREYAVEMPPTFFQ